MADITDLNRHANGKKHKGYVELEQQQLQFSVAKEKAVVVASSQVKGVFSLMLMIAMYICIHGLPISQFPHLMELLKASQAPGVLNVVQKFTNSRYFWGGLFALGEILLRKQVAAIQASPFFSISIDTTCDTSKEEHLLIYCTWLDMCTLTAVTQYLCCVKLTSTTAESISSTVLGVLKCLGLDVKKMVGFCTDGASNMMGVHNGVVTKLKASCNLLIALHCAAHKTGLVMGDIATASPAFARIDSVLKSVHSVFAHSAKRVTMWMHFGTVALGKAPRMFSVFNATRWFSRASCVTVLVSQYMVLILFLIKYKLSPELKDTLRDVEVLMMVHALYDVVQPLNMLSLFCQGENTLPHLLEGRVQNCLSTLKSKLDSRVFLLPVVRTAMADIGLDGVWKGRGPTKKCRIQFVNLDAESISAKFTELFQCLLKETISSFNARFPTESFSLLRCFSALDPTTYVGRSVLDLPGFLTAEFDMLYKEIGVKVWGATVDRVSYKEQVKHLRVVLCRQAEIPRITVQLAWLHIVKEHSYMIPDLITLFHVMMVIVSSTAVVERGFSMHKVIKNKLRNRLKIVTMDSLLRVKFLGPCKVDDFDYENASVVYHTTPHDKMLMNHVFKVVNQIQVPDFESLGVIDEEEDYAPTFSESEEWESEESDEEADEESLMRDSDMTSEVESAPPGGALCGSEPEDAEW